MDKFQRVIKKQLAQAMRTHLKQLKLPPDYVYDNPSHSLRSISVFCIGQIDTLNGDVGLQEFISWTDGPHGTNVSSEKVSSNPQKSVFFSPMLSP